MPLTLVRLLGAPYAICDESFIKTVPAAVPSLFHSSVPWSKSVAVKYSVSPTAVKLLPYADGTIDGEDWNVSRSPAAG